MIFRFFLLNTKVRIEEYLPKRIFGNKAVLNPPVPILMAFHVSSLFHWAELIDYFFAILMSTATSPCILFWVTTKRVPGITVDSRPIAQFTSWENYKLKIYNLTDYQDVFFPGIAISWCSTSPNIISSSVLIFLMSRTSKMKCVSLFLTVTWYEYGRSLSAFNAS